MTGGTDGTRGTYQVGFHLCNEREMGGKRSCPVLLDNPVQARVNPESARLRQRAWKDVPLIPLNAQSRESESCDRIVQVVSVSA